MSRKRRKLFNSLGPPHLARETAYLLTGQPIPDFGWRAHELQNAEQFARAFGSFLDDVHVTEIAGNVAITTKKSIWLIGHPLWPRTYNAMSDEQKHATDRARQKVPNVFWTDARELQTRPDKIGVYMLDADGLDDI